MKRTIDPYIGDRNAVLTSSEEADSHPNDQDSSPPATAHSGSAAPKMVGGSPEGRQTPLPIDGLANDRVQVPSSVAGGTGSGGSLIGPVSDPQLIVRTSSESEGSATASATSPSAQAASPLLPTASLSTVVQQGQVETKYLLGRQALGAKNYEQALMWFQKAAEQGDVKAQFKLALMYDEGEGVKKDLEQAAMWYGKAAEQGHTDAQYNLAMMYQQGEGVEKDLEQAAMWYRKAADQGDADAQNELAVMYDEGEGVELDSNQAAMWFSKAAMGYRKAAEQGDADAQFKLGNRYANGEGVKRDYKQTEMWYRKAAKQGHAGALYYLGRMYKNGEGVEKDLEQGAMWYRKAAEHGHSGAQYELAKMYEKGEGVKKDLKQAVNWYREAADQDDTTASFKLGLMYLKGWGIEKNVSLAAYWVLRSGMSAEKMYIKNDTDPAEIPEITEFFECILDVLRNNSEFKDVKNIRILDTKLTPPYISLVDRLIRFNSNIQRIEIDLRELRHDVSKKSAFADFVSQLVDTIQTFNTSLTNLNFLFLGEDGPELARLNQVLAQNQSIATLREYLQQHPAAHSDELPLEVLMPLADQLIVQGCKSGQSEQAVKAGLNEFLMSAQAGRLNVPIRQPVQ